MRDIQSNVSPKFIKLCTGRQQGVPLRSTKYGRRNQRTETSVVEFSYRCVNSSLEELMKIKVNYSFWDKECLDSKISKNRNVFKPHNQGQQGGVVVVYQYTRKKFAKIPKNTQNASKYTQNYTQVYFIPEIQIKWYTEYPSLSCNIPYTRFKKPLYNRKTLADPA